MGCLTAKLKSQTNKYLQRTPALPSALKARLQVGEVEAGRADFHERHVPAVGAAEAQHTRQVRAVAVVQAPLLVNLLRQQPPERAMLGRLERVCDD